MWFYCCLAIKKNNIDELKKYKENILVWDAAKYNVLNVYAQKKRYFIFLHN